MRQPPIQEDGFPIKLGMTTQTLNPSLRLCGEIFFIFNYPLIEDGFPIKLVMTTHTPYPKP
ncbi:MAG: hypothetical protein WCR42_15755 [bacterium]